MKLRAGVIGLGVGEAHVEALLGHPNVEVIKICDTDPYAIDKVLRKGTKIPSCHNASEVLEDPGIDLVCIASYDNDHHGQIMSGIHHKKHLFVEKPICLSLKEGRDIERALQTHPKLKFSSNLILRKSPRFIDLKDRIERGELGEISFIKTSYNYGRLPKITEGWRSRIPYYSIVLGGGVHLVDLLLWIFSERPSRVTSLSNKVQSKDTAFKYPDLVHSSLEWNSGVVGTLTCNFGCVFPHFHQFEVYGTDKTFINDHTCARLYTQRDELAFEELNTPYPGVHKGDYLIDFVDAIFNDREPMISKKDIFDTLAICLAIDESANTGQPVDINYFNVSS